MLMLKGKKVGWHTHDRRYMHILGDAHTLWRSEHSNLQVLLVRSLFHYDQHIFVGKSFHQGHGAIKFLCVERLSKSVPLSEPFELWTNRQQLILNNKIITKAIKIQCCCFESKVRLRCQNQAWSRYSQYFMREQSTINGHLHTCTASCTTYIESSHIFVAYRYYMHCVRYSYMHVGMM